MLIIWGRKPRKRYLEIWVKVGIADIAIILLIIRCLKEQSGLRCFGFRFSRFIPITLYPVRFVITESRLPSLRWKKCLSGMENWK